LTPSFVSDKKDVRESHRISDLTIPALKKRVGPIAVKFGLKLAILFGSVARGRVRADSDIDIGIVPGSSIFEVPDLYRDFMEDFEPIENDYQRGIDIVQITSENIILLKRILEEGILLYEYQRHYYSMQRLHWRFLVEDNYRYTLNYSDIINRRLEMF